MTATKCCWMTKSALTMSKELKLSNSEFGLLCTTVIVVLASIILSLCIGLILPPNFISKDPSAADLGSFCICNLKNTNVKRLNCKPAFFNIVQPDNANLINAVDSNPFLVSLTVPAYFDDDTERRFACSGIIISTEWILATQHCVSSDIEWLELQVRAGSAYWSKGGTLHNVKKYAKFYKNGPIGIQIEPPFTFGNAVDAVKFVNESDANTWIEAYSANWYEPNVRKIEKYFVEIWSITRCPSVTDYKIGQILMQAKCNTNSPSSSGLISSSDFRSGPYLRWVFELIQTGEAKYNLETHQNGYDGSSGNVTIYGTKHPCLNTTVSIVPSDTAIETEESSSHNGRMSTIGTTDSNLITWLSPQQPQEYHVKNIKAPPH